ncbi:type III-B CRISPR module-associated protein Cmr5 [Bacillus alveayuensis]|jgi:CRISPR-associated protein Cmr5|uniref:type III-B CRISPR module-associated protein Cmr5 n=1 Tax=Aeribacillus alveayuensis TaxID=279215 RepID=UPI0005D114A5|nr:type III-B CRISPR module-associated protein Cmr5 [Bacillus alveayuensis]
MAVERVGIENGRASFAFESVKSAFEDERVTFESYRSYVKKMPSLIQVNGLGQTLAFCYQKGKEYRVIYNQLHKWLKERYSQYFQEPNKEFVEVVIGLKSADYRVLTMEVLALLNWMRKFADGMAKQQ